MTRRYRTLSAVLWPLLCLAQGCAVDQAEPHLPQLRSPRAEETLVPTPTVLRAGGAGVPTPAEPPAPASEPTGVLTLPAALSSVLAKSPELSAYSWSLRAADAEILQASLRPNPELSVNPENFVGSGAFGNQVQFQNTLQLSQLIELGGKRARRTEAAERAKDRTSLEYEAKRVEVLAGATVDFVEVLGDQERLKLSQLAVKQAEDTLGAAAERVRAGVGSPLEEKRARVLLARVRIVERHAEHQLKTSRQNLAARWGGTEPLFASASGELFDSHVVPSLEAILSRLTTAPEREVSVAEERVRAAEVALARTRRTPDVTVYAGWRHGRDWDDQTGIAGFSMPLLIFNRGQGEIAAAEAQESGARVRTRGVETRLRAVLFGLYQEILHAQAEMDAMRKEIVPRSDEALALARKGFTEGLFTQLDLLDAQRTVVEVRQEQMLAASTFHKLVAEAERLLGEPL